MHASYNKKWDSELLCPAVLPSFEGTPEHQQWRTIVVVKITFTQLKGIL